MTSTSNSSQTKINTYLPGLGECHNALVPENKYATLSTCQNRLCPRCLNQIIAIAQCSHTQRKIRELAASQAN